MGVGKAFVVLDTALVAFCVYAALRRKDNEKKKRSRTRTCEGRSEESEKVQVKSKKLSASTSRSNTVSLVSLTSSSLQSSDVAQVGFFVYDTLRRHGHGRDREKSRRPRGKVEVETSSVLLASIEAREEPVVSLVSTGSSPLEQPTSPSAIVLLDQHESQVTFEKVADVTSSNQVLEPAFDIQGEFTRLPIAEVTSEMTEETVPVVESFSSLLGSGMVDARCEGLTEGSSEADLSTFPSKEGIPEVPLQLGPAPKTDDSASIHSQPPSSPSLPTFEEEQTLVDVQEEPKPLVTLIEKQPVLVELTVEDVKVSSVDPQDSDMEKSAVAHPIQVDLPTSSTLPVQPEEEVGQVVDDIQEFLNIITLVPSASAPQLDVLAPPEFKISASLSSPAILKQYMDTLFVNSDENQVPLDNSSVCCTGPYTSAQQVVATPRTIAVASLPEVTKKMSAPRYKRAKRGGKNRRRVDGSIAGSKDKVSSLPAEGSESAPSSVHPISPPSNGSYPRVPSRNAYSTPVSGGVKLGVLNDKSNMQVKKKTSGSRSLPPRKPRVNVKG
ncbi:hypothetical protein C8Q75DRAFT_54673 [Abortiporus biennis]|nr:hypothetical protein C8Q75DRAFT_54673 [Abortiporus biennis]